MFAKLNTCGLLGIEGYIIKVEVFVSGGLPAFDIVGLPDISVKESKERVRAAIKINEYEFLSRRITINLSPASLRKVGSLYDLPIAIALLIATEQIKNVDIKDYIIIGELCLDGKINGVKGVLPIALCAKNKGFKGVIIPKVNEKEASVVNGIKVIAVNNIKEVVDYLNGKFDTTPIQSNINELLTQNKPSYDVDFRDVKGQKSVKRALEIAAAGGHNIIMYGSAGCGKTMLAKRLITILPDMNFNEAIEVTKIHSISGILRQDEYIKLNRPFRAPHHTISQIALVGGGVAAKPGEISLANFGILFLDEMSEFPKKMLESLRQPLEDKKISISRINYSVTYPCKIMLVAALNICPCGNKGSINKECLCSDLQLRRYNERISEALLDRFDMKINVAPIESKDLTKLEEGEESEIIRERVNEARKNQLERFEGKNIFSNADMTNYDIQEYCKLDKQSQAIIEQAFNVLGLSARGYNRILKVARTIADLGKSEKICDNHILEAIQYRSLGKKFREV